MNLLTSLNILEGIEAINRVLLSTSFYNVASSIASIFKKMLTDILTKRNVNSKYFFFLEHLVNILIFTLMIFLIGWMLKKITNTQLVLRDRINRSEEIK